jgi:hypothetical protein
MTEAIELVASKRGADGRWKADTHHPGVMPIGLDADRWITLRALRVLRWTSKMP